MKPFILKQHDKDFSELRELRKEEIGSVSGGEKASVKLNTITVSPHGSSNDGADEG